MKQKLKDISKRFNQLTTTFPIWIVLGISSIMVSKPVNGWKNSETNENRNKMY